MCDDEGDVDASSQSGDSGENSVFAVASSCVMATFTLSARGNDGDDDDDDDANGEDENDDDADEGSGSVCSEHCE